MTDTKIAPINYFLKGSGDRKRISANDAIYQHSSTCTSNSPSIQTRFKLEARWHSKSQSLAVVQTHMMETTKVLTQHSLVGGHVLAFYHETHVAQRRVRQHGQHHLPSAEKQAHKNTRSAIRHAVSRSPRKFPRFEPYTAALTPWLSWLKKEGGYFLVTSCLPA